ncbi:MAG: hypothetical protein RTU09_08635 [Candidatus Thorarchaeota archaeon]
MADHNIQALLLMDKGGIPLFFMKLDPKALDIDPMLVSGFFTAIQSFSREVIEKGASQFQVDYGARLFTITAGKKADLLVVSLGKLQERFGPLLTSMLKEFEKKWLKGMTSEKIASMDIHTCFPKFRESIIHQLTSGRISISWIPFLVTSDDEQSAEVVSPILSHIDGVRTLELIQEQSGFPREEVIEEISRLWVTGTVAFRRILDTRDIIASTSRLDPLLQSSSVEREELTRNHQDVALLLPRLSGMFNGRRTVEEILNALEGQLEREALIDAIDTLLDMQAIEPLSPEKRRILLAKEAMDIAIRVAEKVYSSGEMATALQSSLAMGSAPEVAGEIRLADNTWSVEYDSRLLEGLDPRRLMDLYADWMKLLAQFSVALGREKLKEFVEALTQVYEAYLLNRYTAQDLRGFEEFSFWLELINK